MLFTTANVLRTDIDLRQLLDNFMASSASVLAAASAGTVGGVVNPKAGQQGFRKERYVCCYELIVKHWLCALNMFVEYGPCII